MQPHDLQSDSLEDESAFNREVAALAFSWLERRETSVDKLCKYVIRNTKFPFEEAKSECVLRVMNALLTYDARKANGASLDTHVLGTLKWYLIKLIRTRTPQREAWRKDRLFEHTAESELQYTTDLNKQEETRLLYEMLGELEPDDATALELRFLYEMPLDDIMDVFDCSRPVASRRVARALDNAREAYKRKEMNGHANGKNIS